MLTATFSCFKGISETAEQKLWHKGFFSWRQLLNSGTSPISDKKTDAVKKQIKEAQAALNSGIADWFLNRLEGTSKTRIYPHFKDDIRFIDIETTGLEKNAEITSIAVYDGTSLFVFVAGVNLHDFLTVLNGAKLLVTFNGSRFDLPHIRRHFNIQLSVPHIDLMSVARCEGYRGGMKRCEQKMGIKRQIEEEIDGKTAVELWKRYKADHNLEALRTLAAYNCQDALNLESMLVNIYNQSMKPYPLFKRLPASGHPNVWKSFEKIFDN